MSLKASIFAALGVCFSTTFAYGQDVGLAGELNYAEVGELDGFELGIGFHISASGFRISPTLGGLIYQGELEGFRLEPGNICRDLSNGQFSNSENCDATEFKAYGKIEVSYSLDMLELGVGFRSDENVDSAYGILGYQVSEGVSLRAMAGDEYIAFGLALSR